MKNEKQSSWKRKELSMRNNEASESDVAKDFSKLDMLIILEAGA